MPKTAAKVTVEKPRRKMQAYVPRKRSLEITAPPSKSRSVAGDYHTDYFRQLTRFPLLTAKKELQLSRELEQAELKLWNHVLSVPSFHLTLRSVISAEIETSFSWYKLDSYGKEPAICAKVAQELRAADPDSDLIKAWISHLNPIASTCTQYHSNVLDLFSKVTNIRNSFIQSNLRLVVSMCRKYLNRGMDLMDLVQEGTLGLMRSVGRFDYRRKLRFSTYATWWIRHALGRSLQDHGKTIRIPVHMQEAINKVTRARSSLDKKQAHDPTEDELVAVTGLRLTLIQKADRFAVRMVSLDAGTDPEGNNPLSDVIPDPASLEDPADAIHISKSAELCEKFFHCLKPIEIDILRQRFGLDGDEEKTFQQIGDQYGLSRERIRQLEGSALKKLRGLMLNAQRDSVDVG